MKFNIRATHIHTKETIELGVFTELIDGFYALANRLEWDEDDDPTEWEITLRAVKPHYHCPVNAWDCPYYKDEPNHPCLCTIDGNPYEECDDFAYAWGEADPTEYTDEH